MVKMLFPGFFFPSPSSVLLFFCFTST